MCVSVPGSDSGRAPSLSASIPPVPSEKANCAPGWGRAGTSGKHIWPESPPGGRGSQAPWPRLPPSLKVRAAGAWLGGSRPAGSAGGPAGVTHAGAGMLRSEPGPGSRPPPARGLLHGGGQRGLPRGDPGGGPHVPAAWRGPRLPAAPHPPTSPGSPPGAVLSLGGARGGCGHLTLAGNRGLGSGALELPCPPPSGLAAFACVHSLRRLRKGNFVSAGSC